MLAWKWMLNENDDDDEPYTLERCKNSFQSVTHSDNFGDCKVLFEHINISFCYSIIPQKYMTNFTANMWGLSLEL